MSATAKEVGHYSDSAVTAASEADRAAQEDEMRRAKTTAIIEQTSAEIILIAASIARLQHDSGRSTPSSMPLWQWTLNKSADI
ncbi:hypothetical protein [Pseudomonas oryzihabitans]|uniref:Uncharacterized protein n=1 Tax=Pseudomonas oryzihabitans TaxID=47885 RepID=A0ABX3IT39_9PSED|nr:hypothetical protein [Pseudomonas psychrotolerans]ONN71026.1 hypothetical protein BVL52_10945 [Pseudomonas psychrotolerans]